MGDKGGLSPRTKQGGGVKHDLIDGVECELKAEGKEGNENNEMLLSEGSIISIYNVLVLFTRQPRKSSGLQDET